MQRKMEEEKEREKEKFRSKQKPQKSLKTNKGTIQLKLDVNDKLQVVIPQPKNFSLINFKKGHLTYNSSYSWLVSIFQMILDQNIPDVSSNKSIIYNIYPQKDGVPIYNPKGKYIVKLYCMGKPRKVVIDDRIPCNKHHEFFFPQSSELEEIWAALLTKALFKLEMYKARHPSYYLNEEFMDPHLIYALTGLHASIVDIDSSVLALFKKQFKLEPHADEEDVYYAVFKFYQTTHMEEKRSYEEKISAFKQKKVKKEIKGFNYELLEQFSKSRRMSNETGKDKIIARRVGRNSGIIIKPPLEKPVIPNQRVERSHKKFPTIIENKVLNEVVPMQSREDILVTDKQIIVNFLYSVTDFFENENLNMKRLRFLDFSDLQKQLTERTTQYKQLPLQEKKAYLQSRRDLIKKQLDQKNQRIKELQEKGKAYTLIKLICETFNLPHYEGGNEFSEEKIICARKCLLNHWDYPPVSYFSSFFNETKQRQEEANQFIPITPKGDKQSSTTISTKTNSRQHSTFLWTEEAYIQLIGGDLDIYKTGIEPRKTNIEGSWLTDFELKDSFNKLVIISNHNRLFPNRVYSDNSWTYSKTDVFEPVEEFNAFIFKNDSIENKSALYLMMIVFEPYAEFVTSKDKKMEIFPYIAFDLVDITNKRSVKESLILNKFYSVFSFNEMEGHCEYGLTIKRGTYQHLCHPPPLRYRCSPIAVVSYCSSSF